MSTLILPAVGTLVPFVHGDIARSTDERTYICRITVDTEGNWVIASRLNAESRRWISVNKDRRIGLLVFLNDSPSKSDTHVRISAIKKTGRAVFADPVSLESSK